MPPRHPFDARVKEDARPRPGTVYMLASQTRGTIDTGVTADLPGRLHQHESGTGSVFAKRHGALRPVWHENHQDIRDAIAREKTIKGWRRQWKIEAIERMNPEWHCLKPHLVLW